jgi:hypothetical protein
MFAGSADPTCNVLLQVAAVGVAHALDGPVA